MPEITVSMPAYNSRFIGKAIDSVLMQQGVDFELFIVDDCSTDNTAKMVESYNDPRVKLYKNSEKKGVSFCHNLVIEQSSAPYIIHMDSDGKLADKMAFKKMVDSLKKSQGVGMAYSYFFVIDEDDRVTREDFHKIWFDLAGSEKEDLGSGKEVVAMGPETKYLRAYRREVFGKVGLFSESLSGLDEKDMTDRISEKYKIELVPEFLYCTRNHLNNKPINNKAGLLGVLKSRFKNTSDSKRSIASKLSGFSESLYNFIIKFFYWWPVEWINTKGKRKQENKRIAYYMWRFPILSETFIQREIIALRKSGLYVKVFADEQDNTKSLDDKALSLIKGTLYINPINPEYLKRLKIRLFVKNPFRYINLMLYVIFHRYGLYKNFMNDMQIFDRAVYLAGLLQSKDINHLHCPWANQSAFIALIAAKLLNIKFSLQGRAYDLHRKSQKFLQYEKFTHTDYSIVNTKYNLNYLRSLLKGSNRNIHQIYNGLDLSLFNSEDENKIDDNVVRILCVARITEQKGLEYLLQACHVLKSKGIEYRCEIIGEVNKKDNLNYFIKLKKIHKQLDLKDSVKFLGPRLFKYVMGKYKKTDIFVLPCVIAKDGSRDICPNSIIEAMAMKIPVVSTKITAVSELVDDGINGILVSPNNGKAVADAMIKLIRNSGLRRLMGQKARYKVEQRFDINKNIKEYVNLFSA